MVGTAPRAVRSADAPWARPYQDALVRLRYATSADEDRDFTRFVCYTAAAGRVEWKKCGDEVLDAEARAFLLRVARESLEHGVRTGRAFPRGHFTQDAPKSTLLKMGAFVTLNDKTTGALRGCIGEILPMRPLVEAVAERAVDSALHDPRFMPVEESELGNLRVEVSALTPPKPVASWHDIVLGRDGMTLEKGNAFAVFLPQVAPEQGWDLPTTLTYLSQKAGLPSNAWRNGATFETFQAEVFHE
jgi:AmmeMemoRadiSam system protein A